MYLAESISINNVEIFLLKAVVINLVSQIIFQTLLTLEIGANKIGNFGVTWMADSLRKNSVCLIQVNIKTSRSTKLLLNRPS